MGSLLLILKKNEEGLSCTRKPVFTVPFIYARKFTK
jgi:hypothetical protein